MNSSSTIPLNPARQIAARMPDLLVEAERVANSISLGFHGRRQSGSGENFWQYRPHSSGEAAARIDWRRSASQDNLMVREQEWEAAHTIWLWPDMSSSMAFASSNAYSSKLERALLLTLVLTITLTRSGEKVGIPTVTPARGDRLTAELFMSILAKQSLAPLPNQFVPKRFTDLIIFGDFLGPETEMMHKFSRLAAEGSKVHLVQILDPVEESFPFKGRVEFSEPGSNLKFNAGKAEDLQQAYQDKLAARKAKLQETTKKLGWTYSLHHTDRNSSEVLMALHQRLSSPDAGRFAA